ncbi:MAG: ABC transporter permease [Prolixibacteraceae bacterium]|jgi:putative ABC transport system permease protein|nr:ABC transporter permease [Prolixibacteraceae bacterium]
MKRFITNIVRSVKTNPLYTTINSIGLIIGFVCVVFISFWIKNELSYDRLHQNADNIYRVHRYFYDANGTENLHLPFVAPPIAPLLKDEFPEIENIVRVSHTGMLFSLDNQKIVEQDVCFAEPDILKIFTFDGLPSEADLLEEPLTAVVSESIAKKYFKGDNAIGNTLEFSDNYGTKYNLRVTGTFKNWTGNSHFHPEIFISFSTYMYAVGENELNDWGSNNYETFAQMPHQPKELDAKLDAFINKQFENGTSWTKLRMEKLADIHFNWYGNRSYIYILSSIALLILFLGCINYMNLNTAIYTKRMKEIQIKKIAGASRSRIASQLITESVIFCILSLALALIIVSLTLSRFDQVFNSTLSFQFNENIFLIVGFLILSIFIGSLSGTYPALFTLSNKMSALSKLQNTSSGKMSFRNLLIVFQFFVSIALIISFLIVNKQLNFLRNKNLGFNKENVITLNASPNLIEKLDVFRQELIQNPNIISVSGSKRIPSQRLDDSNEAKVINNGKMEPLGFRVANVRIDDYFLPTYEIKLLAGNNIQNRETGEAEYLINKMAVEKIGWKTPEAAIGQHIEYGGIKGKVVGVVQNFHYESLHNDVFPILLYSDLSSFNRVSIRISPSNINNTIAFIEKNWQNYNVTGTPYSYQFVDERFGQLYQSEEYTRTIFSYFMVLAITIAILGLFGLSIFVMERRTKEIGIRKINGAKISEVLMMLNKDFLKWVAIAFVIATPLAYYAMTKWLENFAYKTELSWWIFALAGLLALGIALITVSFQSWKAAMRNPVESLRYE